MIFACENKNKDIGDGLYAEFNTSMGTMLIKLTYEKTPVTVANFIALAEGRHPKVSDNFKGIKYYDGTIFHRVIDNFMIQGGDPFGNGSGGPGYKFLDEIDLSLNHDKPGVLSMANSGPGTNGSQFFITEVATPHLNGRHTVFGHVIKGIEVQDAISNVETAIANRPKNDVILESINIFRVGENAKNFDAVSVWNEMEPKLFIIEKEKKRKRIEEISVGYEITDSGIRYKLEKLNKNKIPKKGDRVRVHYSGKLIDGTLFDSSYSRNTPFEFNVGLGEVIKGWDEALSILRIGEKGTFIIPSELAYGVRGAGGVIPPNANLVFEIELLEIID